MIRKVTRISKDRVVQQHNISARTLAILQCTRKSYKIVTIRTKTEKVTKSRTVHYCGIAGEPWVEGQRGASRTDRIKMGYYDGKTSMWPNSQHSWPAMWYWAKVHKIGGGCGNSHQYQLDYKIELSNGVYDLRFKKIRKIQP